MKFKEKIKKINPFGKFKWTKHQKSLSELPEVYLDHLYEETEEMLSESAKAGDLKLLKDRMNVHTDLEYALLYKHYARSNRKE